MGLVIAAFVVLIVFIVAAVVVGREARRLDAVPPRPVFDMNKAVVWVAEHLPFEVSAVLSHDDVRRIIDWNLEYFRTRGVAGNGSAHHVEEQVIVGGSETVAYVLARAQAAGADYTPVQLHAVLDAQMSYLEAIGAIGPEAPPDEA